MVELPKVVYLIFHIASAVVMVLVASAHWHRMALYNDPPRGDFTDYMKMVGESLGYGFHVGVGPGWGTYCLNVRAGHFCATFTGGVINDIALHRTVLVMCGLCSLLLVIFHILMTVVDCGEAVKKLKEWDNLLWRSVFELVIGFITLGASADLGIASGILCILVSTTWIVFFFIYVAHTGHPYCVADDGGTTEPPKGDIGYPPGGYADPNAPYLPPGPPYVDPNTGYPASGTTYVDTNTGYPASGTTYVDPNTGYPASDTTYVDPSAQYVEPAAPCADGTYIPPQY
jgi:hypothetical protein